MFAHSGSAGRAPEGEDLPEEHVGEALDSREGAVRRRRAAAFDETSENEQLLPRLADVALPRAGGPDALEERDHVLDCASRAPKVSNYLTVRIILVWRRLFKRIPDTRVQETNKQTHEPVTKTQIPLPNPQNK